MIKRNFVLIFILFYIVSCNTLNNDLKKTDSIQSGIAISFDDHFIYEWSKADSLLQMYNWKATFFISNFGNLSLEDIEKLKNLQSNGHEIGGHGYLHLNAPQYISKNTLDDYFNKEIEPMINSMKANGFEIESFAYPYSWSNSLSDALLLNKFKIVRCGVFGAIKIEKQPCFFNGCRIVYGLEIDQNQRLSSSYIISLLEYAKNNNKIVILYAHKPVKELSGKYEVQFSRLEEICKFVKQNNMKFYTLSELIDLVEGK